MADTALLNMLAAEAQRRSPEIIAGVEELVASDEKDPDRIEGLRVEAHGLKGAALVVEQNRLADLAKRMETFLAGAVETGGIAPADAAKLIAAASAFSEGAQAAAEGVGEPSSVSDSLEALGG
jgi:chemotaxis protein histidine kinase CheA